MGNGTGDSITRYSRDLYYPKSNTCIVTYSNLVDNSTLLHNFWVNCIIFIRPNFLRGWKMVCSTKLGYLSLYNLVFFFQEKDICECHLKIYIWRTIKITTKIICGPWIYHDFLSLNLFTSDLLWKWRQSGCDCLPWTNTVVPFLLGLFFFHHHD